MYNFNRFHPKMTTQKEMWYEIEDIISNKVDSVLVNSEIRSMDIIPLMY